MKKIIFLSWHNSLPGLIKPLYSKMPLEKYFIARNHIKPPKLFDKVLMSKPNSFSYNTDEEVINKITELDPDAVLVWNGDFNDENRGFQVPLIKRIKNSGKRVIYAEHGWLPQKGTFTVDNEGSNGSSENVNKTSLGNDIDNNFLKQKRKEYRLVARKPHIDDYIFIVLQISTDTQITKYSPYFRNMFEFIDYVNATFPKSKKVFKVHPKDPQKPLIRDYINSLNDTCIYVEDTNQIGWGLYSRFVLSINSTLVNEMLLFYKKVFTFGKNYFSNKGVTLECDPTKSLNYGKYEPDKEKIDKYLTGLSKIQFQSNNPDINRALSIWKLK